MKIKSLSSIMSVALLSLPAAAAEEKILASFKDAASVESWISVNDGVMGGVSKGGFKRTDAGTMVFSGDLSLENNGGFASMRSKPNAMDLSGVSSIAVKAKGDGRTYWLELRVARQMGASSYRADLPTTAGEWKDVVVPLKDFKLQAFGMQLPSGPIDPSKVESIGFTLADKKAGPFELEVASVRAVTGGEVPAKAKGGKTIVNVAEAAGSFKTLLAAAAAADLASTLSEGGPFTVFAPTDEAFAKLPKGTVDELIKPENREKLASILKYHVIAGRVSLAKALEVGQAATLQGAKVTAKFENGRVLIGPATLVKADIAASNGVIHVIDQVLLPPEAATSKPLAPTMLIELAIRRGVPLFNDGDPAACAAVYEITCESLRVMPGVSEKMRADLGHALDEMHEEKTAKQKAWILRNALDRAYTQLR
ncbi:MAG: CIA30 family protein [Verrucomicrobiaceae bacterium]